MRLSIAVVALSLAAGTTASAQNLFSNAGGYGSGLIGLSTGTVTGSGVAAAPGNEWSEVQASGGVANTNAGFGYSGTFRVADNFTVNDPAGWNVNAVRFYAYVTGGGAITNYTLRVWNQTPNTAGTGVIFGDTTTNRLGTVTNTNLFRIFNTTTPAPGTPPGTTRQIREIIIPLNLVLGPGTYWLDWSANAGFYPSITLPGTRGLSGWDALQFSGTAWTPAVDTGNPVTTPSIPQDLPFVINGTPVPTPGVIAVLGLGGLVAARRRR